MDNSFIKDTNPILKKKSSFFIIINDELKYKRLDEDYENKYHLDTVQYVHFNSFKSEIKIITNSQTFKILKDKNQKLFCDFLNLEKYYYSIYFIHSKFEKDEKFRFNVNEYNINLKQYGEKEIFNEILNNIFKKQNDFEILMQVIELKIKNYLIDFETLIVDNNYMPIFNNIELNFKEKFIEFFKNKASILNCKIQSLDKNNNTEDPCRKIINSIQLVHQDYLNLFRIYTELKKCIIILNQKFKIYKENNFDRISCTIKYSPDFYNRFINKFIKLQENKIMKNCLLDEEKIENQNLKEKFSDSIIKNQKYKEILKKFISDQGFQIVFCFQCGNILKRTDKQISNCLFDNKCKNFSYFFCINCKLNLCTYCTVSIRNGQCSKKHLIFKFQGEFSKNCQNCDLMIEEEGYGCNLCNINICCICYESTGNKKPYKCYTCKFELVWKRKYFSNCRKCNLPSECYYKCFFCDFDFCVKCLTPQDDYCGGLHSLEKNNIEENYISATKLKIRSFLFTIVENSCSICNNNFEINFYHCKRCNYVKCNQCSIKAI